MKPKRSFLANSKKKRILERIFAIISNNRSRNISELKLSICVPIFLRNDEDLGFLAELLRSIQIQDFDNYEIILSEDAGSMRKLSLRDLGKIAGELNEIRIIPSESHGISANTNFAVSSSRGRYVKLMFQDDFLAHSSALQEVVDLLDRTRKRWLLCGCDHLNEKTKQFGPSMIPKLRGTLFNGVNSVSSPSVVAFRRENFLMFSNTLSLMMDCEWYIRMSHHYGKPVILDKITVINRLHSNQAQHSLKSTLVSDREKVASLHNKKQVRKSRCMCRN